MQGNGNGKVEKVEEEPYEPWGVYFHDVDPDDDTPIDRLFGPFVSKDAAEKWIMTMMIENDLGVWMVAPLLDPIESLPDLPRMFERLVREGR